MRKQRSEKNEKTEVAQKNCRKQRKAGTVQQVIDGGGVQLGTSERPGRCQPSPLRKKIEVCLYLTTAGNLLRKTRFTDDFWKPIRRIRVSILHLDNRTGLSGSTLNVIELPEARVTTMIVTAQRESARAAATTTTRHCSVLFQKRCEYTRTTNDPHIHRICFEV